MLKFRTIIRIRKKKLIAVIIGICAFFSCFDNPFLASIIPVYAKGLFLMRLAGILLLLLFLFINRKKPGTVTLLMSAMYTIMSLSTVLHGGDLISFWVLVSNSLVIVLSLDVVSDDEAALDCLLNAWKYLIILMLMIDLMTEILYPGGLYHDRLYSINWFLGYKTARMTYIVPLLFISIYQSYKKKQTFRKSIFLIMAISIVDVWLSQASGATVSLIVIVFLTILILNLYRKKLQFIRNLLLKIFDSRLFIGVYMAVTFIVVIVNYTPLMSKVADLIGKDMTFTGRTFIWKACMSEFVTSPIIGKGYWLATQYEQITIKYGVYGGTNAHNAIITILMDGGIIAIILYLMIYLIALRQPKERKQYELILIAIIYVTWILGLTSSAFVFSPYVFMMYWLFLYSQNRKMSLQSYLLTLINRKEII